MRRKTLFILTAVFSFSLSMLVGCGDQQEANNNITEQPTTTETPTSTPTETATPTPEPTATSTLELTNTSTPVSTNTPIPTPTEIPHEHAYAESISQEATCTETGEKTFTCDCGDTYTESTEATGHSYETVANSSAEPTCTKEGKKADMKCSLCGDTKNGETVPATGHSYGNYVYNNDATTEKDGTETATCSDCGKKNTRTKPGTKLVKEEPNTTVTLDDAIAYASSQYPLYQIVDNGGNNVQTYILCCTGTLTAEENQRLNDLGTTAEVGTARLVRDRGYGNGRSTLTNLEFFGENNKFIVVKIDFSTTTQ